MTRSRLAPDDATAFDELFAPDPLYLPDKCPHCNHTHATRQINDNTTDTGKATIRTPALQITTEHGCLCNNCKATWTPDRLQFLGKLLGYRIEGITE